MIGRVLNGLSSVGVATQATCDSLFSSKVGRKSSHRGTFGLYLLLFPQRHIWVVFITLPTEARLGCICYSSHRGAFGMYLFIVGCFCRVDPSLSVAPARWNHRTVAQDVGAKIQLRQDDL